MMRKYCYIFFFQAEDGIRDKLVTGVQTCALPISFAALGRGAVTQERLLSSHTGRASGFLWGRAVPERNATGHAELLCAGYSISCAVPLALRGALVSGFRQLPTAGRGRKAASASQAQ